MAKTTTEFNTLYKDAQVPTPGGKGDWGGTTGGASIPGGMKATKGVITEVTTIALKGIKSDKPGLDESGGGLIAGKKKG